LKRKREEEIRKEKSEKSDEEKDGKK
jgi:hypothetical protein